MKYSINGPDIILTKCVIVAGLGGRYPDLMLEGTADGREFDGELNVDVEDTSVGTPLQDDRRPGEIPPVDVQQDMLAAIYASETFKGAVAAYKTPTKEFCAELLQEVNRIARSSQRGDLPRVMASMGLTLGSTTDIIENGRNYCEWVVVRISDLSEYCRFRLETNTVVN